MKDVSPGDKENSSNCVTSLRDALAGKAVQRASNKEQPSRPGTSSKSEMERLQEGRARLEHKVARARLFMAKKASMEQDLRLRTAYTLMTPDTITYTTKKQMEARGRRTAR